jgi:hypothetical protein
MGLQVALLNNGISFAIVSISNAIQTQKGVAAAAIVSVAIVPAIASIVTCKIFEIAIE